jgi:hypothetical protein
MEKSKYLRHPFQAAKTAKSMLAAHWNMWNFANHGKRRFQGDVRFDLQHVTDGFLSRVDHSGDDVALLERICAAYNKTVQQQQSVSEAYKATAWWKQIQQRSLCGVMRALVTRDIDALRRMYSNFFRDPCSSGLLAAPYGMSKAYFGGRIKDVHRCFYLSHVLYRFDYWMEQTNNRFTLRDLAGPGIGNPFGVVIDGTHIHVGAEYAHYCADKVTSLLRSKKATVAEIGAGFGGMAYYLLRDRPEITYLDFDVPESVALISYYLMKAFPERKFLLYGEEKLTEEAIARADVVLMPLFELQAMPAANIDITFSSHAMSNISSEAMIEYLKNIDRITRGYFVYLGKKQASDLISDLVVREHKSFQLTDTRTSGWHSHKVSGAGVGGAAALAASIMFEQCYMRTTALDGLPAK